MRKILYITLALFISLIIGCATSKTYSLKPYCQGETAKFLRSNVDPDKIAIEDISTEHYAGKKSWHFWTATTPNGSRYKCQAFTGDKTCYCTKLKIDNQAKKEKNQQKTERGLPEVF